VTIDPGAALETIQDEAALWVARLRGGNCTLHDKRAFRAWLIAAPAHASAFEAMQSTWELAGALPQSVRPGYRSLRAVGRREMAWGLGAAAIASGAAFSWQSAAAKTYDTRIGEQKHITLPDGSLAFLDTDSHVSFQGRGDLRLVRLISGRANLRIVPGDGGIFRIEAGQQVILTERSQLDVREDGGATAITLIDGQASVDSGHPGKGQKFPMRGGDRLRASRAGLLRDRPNLSAILAWQRGQVVFDNSTLAQAAAELNRYSEMKLAVVDPVVASWRVSGIFPVGDNYAFVRAAAKFLPLGMIPASGHILMVQDPAHAKLG
jgi:transmembrane sensor